MQLKNIIKNLLTKFKHIILGTYYNMTNKKTEISYPRLQICKTCENNKIQLCFGNYCDICGCILKSKTRVIDEKCPVNKW